MFVSSDCLSGFQSPETNPFFFFWFFCLLLGCNDQKNENFQEIRGGQTQKETPGLVFEIPVAAAQKSAAFWEYGERGFDFFGGSENFFFFF